MTPAQTSKPSTHDAHTHTHTHTLQSTHMPAVQSQESFIRERERESEREREREREMKVTGRKVSDTGERGEIGMMQKENQVGSSNTCHQPRDVDTTLLNLD